MKRRMLGALALLVVGLAASAPLHANHACVNVSVTAPVVGTRGASQCQPVPLPPQFDTAVTVSNCGGIPPLGVSDCESVSVHLPLP